MSFDGNKRKGLFIAIDANIGAGKANACHAIASSWRSSSDGRLERFWASGRNLEEHQELGEFGRIMVRGAIVVAGQNTSCSDHAEGVVLIAV